MAEIINLRRARKQRDRREKQDRAGENRILFGRSKAEKRTLEAETQRTERRLDGHLRDSGDDPDKD